MLYPIPTPDAIRTAADINRDDDLDSPILKRAGALGSKITEVLFAAYMSGVETLTIYNDPRSSLLNETTTEDATEAVSILRRLGYDASLALDYNGEVMSITISMI